jgi:hypothetical protein
MIPFKTSRTLAGLISYSDRYSDSSAHPLDPNNRPEYAIQLANKSVWEARTGFNNLGHKLEVE